MTEKTINTWKWISTIAFFIAAIMLSSNVEISKWGFVIFAGGHLIYTVLFTKLKDWPMVAHGVGFLLIDLYGIWRWFV